MWFHKNDTNCFYPSQGAEPELKLSSIPIRPIPLTSLVRLYDLEVDPTEQNDISNSNLEIVEFMLAQLVAFNQTQVPGMLIWTRQSSKSMAWSRLYSVKKSLVF